MSKKRVDLINTLALFSMIWVLISTLFGFILIGLMLITNAYIHSVLDIFLATALAIACVAEALILKMWLTKRIVML